MVGGKKHAVAAAFAVAMLMGSASAIAAGKEDVNARRVDGSTPLQWAAFNDDVAEAKRLIAAGADIKLKNNYGISAMLLAADIASTDMIQLLLKNGADANSANPDGETALHLVARANNLEAARLLVKAGAKVDPREKLGEQTPLMWAVARRHPAMVEYLISQGADVNARGAIRDYQRVATAESRAKSLDRGGLTPLLYAARENCRECADILIKHGADVNLPDPSRVVPLVIAMINGNFDIAKKLIEAGADVNQWDIYGQSPLHVAIGGGGRSSNPLDADFPQKATSNEILQMIIDRGANPNQQTYFRPAVRGGGGRGTTPFLVAVGTGNMDLIKQLIAKGANVKLSTSDGNGAIHAAAAARGGGGGGGPPGGGGGPPGGGAPGGAPGADGNDGDGTEPGAAPAAPAPAAAPRAAVAPGIAGTLAGAQAPGGGGRGGGPGGAGGPGGGGRGAGAGGAGGAAPGAGAANRPNPQVELIKFLAAEGADVHAMAHRNFLTRSRGGSVLHYVVRGGANRQVIEALLALGLDINVKDDDGLTALDYAMGRGYVPFLQMAQPPNKQVADMLRSLGATVELDRIPDWPPQGPPIATAVYDSVLWPVDPVGP
jgi:ankyrin repeat protein